MNQAARLENVQMVGLVECSGTGTKVLQSILDGHPEILSIPSYPMVYFYPHWQDWTSQAPDITWKELLELFCTKHASVLDSTQIPGFNGLNNIGDNQNESLKIDEDIFKKSFLDFTKESAIDSKTMLLAIHYSFAKAINQNLEPVKIIIYHLHNDIYLAPLKKDFPDMKVIGMYRDPRANSITRAEAAFKVDQAKLSFTDCFLHRKFVFANHSLYCFHNIFNINSYADNKNIIIIKHEDLYYHLNDILKHLINWLNISYHENLESMTFAGKKWWGDKVYGKKLENKVSASVVSDSWKNKLTSFEIFLIEATAFELLHNYNYPRLFFNDSKFDRLKSFVFAFLPMRLERQTFNEYFQMNNIHQYIKNIFEEINNPEALKDYTFNAAYKHKWDYKRQKFYKRKFISPAIYVVNRLFALIWGFLKFPYVMYLRYRIMYSIYWRRSFGPKLVVPPRLTATGVRFYE